MAEYRNINTGTIRRTVPGEFLGELLDCDPNWELVEQPPEPFDPSSHTVAEVVAHLEGADDDEHSRVIEAEQAGKNRTGIVG